MKKCIIIAGGMLESTEDYRSLIRSAQLVICADSGAAYMRKINLLPDVIIGDLDSIRDEDRYFFESKQVRIIQHPANKDATDTELAVSLAIRQKVDDITLIGWSGTRMDHTLANVLLLKKLSEYRVPCRMIDAHNEVWLITDHMDLAGIPGELVSIIPLSEKVCGVTISGLEYPLENATISMGSSIGISNRFVTNIARISLEKGILLVFKSRD